MKLIIVEKPSVGQSVAKVVGAATRKDGFLEGNGYIVSWCVGHLIHVADPETYDEKYKKWSIADLPILPNPFQYEVSIAKSKQLSILCQLLKRSDVDCIVNGCDAGREGELIFRLVYDYAKSKKPMERLWISSMEDVAIRQGMDNLKSGKEFDDLYQSALCRLHADWLVGINATRLFSSLYNQTLNVGRVMSPTLAMIVERNHQNEQFKPKPYYRVVMENEDLSFSSEKFEEREEIETLVEELQGQSLVVESINQTEKKSKPPKLYDLTTLQRDANRKLGYTASETLDIVQSLYEKKLTTYPRTDSSYLTDEMESGLYDLSIIAMNFLDVAIGDGLEIPQETKQVINAKKVTDHHAIIPTQTLKYFDFSSLSKPEQEILKLIVVRFLAALAEKHTYTETIAFARCGDLILKSQGKVVNNEGFKKYQSLFVTSEDKEESMSQLMLVEGNRIENLQLKIKEGQTTPPKQFTEDTLLSAMERASADEVEIEKEFNGIGTPATRAGIIEKLVKIGLIERKGTKKVQQLLPTKKGIALISVLPKQLQSPITTAEWEKQLQAVERGELSADEFMQGITKMVEDLIALYEKVENTGFEEQYAVMGACPRCGGDIVSTAKSYRCSSHKCEFIIWKENRFFTAKKKKLTDFMMKELLQKGEIGLRGCHSEKTGKTYDAVISIDDTQGKYVNFKMEFTKTNKAKKE